MNQPNDANAIIARAVRAWLPPLRLSLTEWADRHFALSTETSAEPGRWHALPYQRAILEAISDPAVSQVTLMKSARVGYTLCMSAAIGYFIEHEPTSIMVVQPTVEDAKSFSKETIAPMLRDVPVLARLTVSDMDENSSGSSETLTHKVFPGGILSLVGANSGTGFRRVSRRVIMFDEVDAYPSSAGRDGDPIKLGMKRSEYFWNRKIIAGSTPLVAGSSRIEEMFEAGDQRRYFVPCPHCAHMDFLRFSLRDDNSDLDGGHVMRWDSGKPETAHFECRSCGCDIEETSKYSMLEAGEWRAAAEFGGHASFHIWAAYSLSPNATWRQIASEFLEAKAGGLEKLKTFVNTTLGQTWKERGEAPDWERLYQRREPYKIGSVPVGVVAITAGVDVQKDRFVYEVVGWSPSKESWSIDAGEIYGDTALDSTWDRLDELLARTYQGEGASELPIQMLAIDSGYATQTVYGWARKHPLSRVIACKGQSGARLLIGSASSVDIGARGNKIARGYRMFSIGVDIAKGELYGWLRLTKGDGDPPPGYCHFPEYGEEYFKQLTAEHLVTTVNSKTRRATLSWSVLPNRENHFLDARILARAAASLLGIDRMATKPRTKPASTESSSESAENPTRTTEPTRDKKFWKRPRSPGGNWFKPRR
ncbi:MAG: phage terminase large subunit family protein [Gemmatimonadaceae bacterium]|nr:phage terminase large subunit family protein [Gemmatimonadaceae bacterium]